MLHAGEFEFVHGLLRDDLDPGSSSEADASQPPRRYSLCCSAENVVMVSTVADLQADRTYLRQVVGETAKLEWKRQGREWTRQHGTNVAFLRLWARLVSVQNHVSVSNAREFQAGLKTLLEHLTQSTDPLTLRGGLEVLHEVLCYGSTLALQEAMGEGVLNLARDILQSFETRALDRLVDHCPAQGSGFLGSTQISPTASSGPNRPLILGSLVLLVVKSLAVLVRQGFYCSSSEDSDNSSSSRSSSNAEEHSLIEQRVAAHLMHLHDLMVRTRSWLPNATLIDALVDLLLERDDLMIESMLCLLDVHHLLRISLGPATIAIDPVWLFQKYMSECAWDASVILDFLISRETCFLLYLLKLLKYLNRLDRIPIPRRVSSFLCEFHVSLEQLTQRELFPYEIRPLLDQFARFKAKVHSPGDRRSTKMPAGCEIPIHDDRGSDQA